MSITVPPLSLYIHFPWCIQKCPYCDFNSHKLTTELPEADYCTQLIHDLKLDLHWVQNRPIQSIFLGGGTPSLFSPKALEQLLQNIFKLVSVTSDLEITIEANPGTLSLTKLQQYHTIGINRLSLGVQSFNNKQLQFLGRIHDSTAATQAIEWAQQAHFDQINIDIMFGLANQDLVTALADLKQAINLQPQHISWYQLTIEPNTLFYRQRPQLPPNDLIAEMGDQGRALLAQNSFPQYEISAYAQREAQCKHNMNYWQFGDYLGIGAGAHGKVTTTSGDILRYRKPRQPLAYMQGKSPLATAQSITQDKIYFEFMLNALRLTAGVPQEYFEQRTGLSIQHIKPLINTAQQMGLLMDDNKRLQATTFGQNHLNELYEIFLSP